MANPRQARFRKELKRLLRRGIPAAKAMKQAWRRVPKNPRHRQPRANPVFRRAKASWPTARGAWMDIGEKTGIAPRDTVSHHTSTHWVWATKNPLTRAKARTILHEGRARGHPLTPAQRGLFGAVASGSKLRDYPALNPPPIKLFANGRLVGMIGFRPTLGRKVSRNPRIDIRV